MGKLDWLAEPLTRHLDLDDPQTTLLRAQMIRRKPFLRRIYEDWYRHIVYALPSGGGPVLELGSGAGFLKDFIPELITSEVFYMPFVNTVMKGEQLPFADGSLRAVVMVDVLHHIPNARAFFSEAARCVRSGGALVMIEPWVTSWSALIYRHLHHEPFLPEAKTWEFATSGPLSGANEALPWIIFRRDLPIFQHEFPQLKVRKVEPIMPFRYLVSGGLSKRSLMPGWSYKLWDWVEAALARQNNRLGMFAIIALHHL